MKVYVYQQCGGPCNDSYVKVFASKDAAQEYFDKRAAKLGESYSWKDVDESDWKYNQLNGIELFITSEEVHA